MNNQHIVVSVNLKRTIKIMKLTVLMLTVCLSQMVAATYAQTTKLNVSAKEETLENVLKQIEKQSEFLFFYNLEEINKNEKISISKKNANIQDVLETIATKTGLRYTIKDRHIVLTTKHASMSAISQQSQKVTGVISDAMGPVAGANVIQKGTTNGTTTDIDGKYSIDVPANATLVVSFIGYTPQDVAVKGQSVINILLKEDTQALEEVVVVGYGTMKKKDLTGAVASVKMDDTPVGTVSTVSHALAGKAAGLQVSTISAQPGGQSTFRIRGAASSDKAGNDPLIIIDGFPVSAPDGLDSGNQYKDGNKDNILGSINPNDIESIEVLKDASSTAIYGARAGNGVIIVTTKRGKSGAAKVQYSGSVSVQDIAKSYEMLDASGFMQATNNYNRELWLRTNGVGIYGGKSESEIGTPFVPTYTVDQIANPANNTNWFDEISRLGFQTSHNLSITGGNDNTKYLISGNYFKQDGVIKNNAMERYSARVNLDQKLSKYVKMGVNLNVSRNEYDNIPLGDGQNENAGILVSAAQFNPALPIRDENGDYSMNSDASFLPNPVSLLDITDKTTKERLLGNVFFEVRPIQDLLLKANFGIDRNYQKRKQYMPTTTLYGARENGSAYVAQADNSDYLMELTANYSKQIGEHNFGVLAGHSYQLFTYEMLSGKSNDFITDGFLYNNLGAGNAKRPTVGSSATKSRMASFFGRVNYSFRDRYLLTATIRTDGSSNFAEGNRWGVFPSVAAGWRFLEEDFMSPLKNVLSNGKLRLSYGETGNSNVGDVAYSYYKVKDRNNIFGGSMINGVYLDQLGNGALTWETTREWNVGLDLGFLDGRVNVTAEYYHKNISDLLNERTLLSYNEVNKIIANVGKTQSQGFELTINTTNIRNKNFEWTSDLTFSLYRDKWKERDPNWKPKAYDEYNGWMRYYSGYLSDGLVQPGETIDHMPGALPGQVKIKDIDGYVYEADGSIKVDEHGIPMKTGKPDGKLDDADKVIYGSKDPGYLMGFNNTLRYKNFDFNIYFYGQFDKLSAGSYKKTWISNNVNDLRRGYNQPTSIKDIWSSANPNGTLPGYFQTESAYGTGDYYYEKTWFIRCRNITLGYNIPLKTSKHILSNVRVYFDVNNPFIITPYTGLDPETDVSSDKTDAAQLQWAYPNVRTYSFGLDITF